MLNCSMLLSLYEIYENFQLQMKQRLHGIDPQHPLDVVVADFFDICIHRASDSVSFFDDERVQRRYLHPGGLAKMHITGMMQDIFFDEFANYVFESNYFHEQDIENRHVHFEIASLCVSAVEEILREIMLNLASQPTGRMYFHPDSATVCSTITDMIIHPQVRHHDIHVYIGFE